MKRKIVWQVLGFLVVLSLVMAACAPKAPAGVTPAAPRETTPTAPKEAAPTAPAAPKQTVTPAAEAPKYGGILKLGILESGINSFFDQLYMDSSSGPSLRQTNEQLLTGDWSRGPAGTKEFSFNHSGFAVEGFQDIGNLAESWEIPDDQTLIFKIRQGVHFHDKPPVNGREMDANDVAFSINYIYLNQAKPLNYATTGAPGGKKVLSAVATDNRTVVVKVEGLSQVFLEEIAERTVVIIAHESIEKYGNLLDWRNALGTGPFMLTDLVRGSSMTLTRNPHWWKTDPIGPGKGNQLPYIDGIQLLIIPDIATQLTAMRTGKVDQLNLIAREDKDSLARTNPEIKFGRSSLGGSPNNYIAPRATSTSAAAIPLMNKRVRQALAMAIDYPSMIKDYYDGQAAFPQLFAYPGTARYTKIEDMPEILERVHGFSHDEAQMVQKMYTYHPDEAKKLLTEAGYPNGFPIKILYQMGSEETNQLSIISSYWGKLGVVLTLDGKDRTNYFSAFYGRAYDMILRGAGAAPGNAEKWQHYLPNSESNSPDLNDDQVIQKATERTYAVYGDVEARNKIIKETEPYVLQTGWYIPLPAPYAYRSWQPWLKNYYGTGVIGYKSTYNWAWYAWLDEDLKAEVARR